MGKFIQDPDAEGLGMEVGGPVIPKVPAGDDTQSSDSHPLTSGWWTGHDGDVGAKTPK